MLNQHPLLNTVDPYVEPLLKTVLQNKRLGICYHLVRLESAWSSTNKAKSDCFKLSIPYAGEYLVWNILFNSQCLEMGPDFIFNDQNFLADPDVDVLSNLVPSLVKWNPNNTDALFNVLVELLQYYKNYQIQLLESQGERLQFEYSTLIGDTEIHTEDVEVIMLPLGAKATEARFLIRIRLNEYIDYSQLPLRSNKSQNNEAMLIITFFGPDWNRIVPQLHLSKNLEDFLGGSDTLRTLPFPHNKYLMDYVPEVKKFIEEKIKTVVHCFESRKNFVTILILLQRGCLIEYDSLEFNWIVILLVHRDFHFLVHFRLPPTFPKEKPQVILQSVYHMASQGVSYEEVLDDIPYNSEWQPGMMLERLLPYIVETAAPKFQANSVKKNNRF